MEKLRAAGFSRPFTTLEAGVQKYVTKLSEVKKNEN
jgi:hypothetical protein